MKGTLEATSASGGDGSFGVQAYDGSLTIESGGSVTATAGNSSKSIGLSCGGGAGGLTVAGTLIAKGNSSALGNYSSAREYTVAEGQTAMESASYDGSNATSVAVGNATAATSKYVKIAPLTTEPAAVTEAPTAKDLTYNGSAQELVTDGIASGGKMYYALGTATEATEPYNTLL